MHIDINTIAVDLKNDPAFLEMEEQVKSRMGQRDWQTDSSTCLKEVVSWKHATGDHFPFSARPQPHRGQLSNSPDASYSFGFNATGELRIWRLRLGPNSWISTYVFQEGDRLVGYHYEEGVDRGRFQAAWIEQIVDGEFTREVGISVHGDQSRILVLPGGENILLVFEATSRRQSMESIQRSVVHLGSDGAPEKIFSSDGRLSHQRHVKLPKDLEVKATKAMVSEIAKIVKLANKAEEVAGIVVVHGQGPELFPPHLFTVPKRLLPVGYDATWLEPYRLETAGLEPTYLLSEPAPTWLSNVNLSLNDEAVVARLLHAMVDATKQLATVKWPLKQPPLFVWLHDIEDGTWTAFHPTPGPAAPLS